MRIILFTGKGGVGKTTLAAATALHAASLGYRTLVISTDPAHSLADAFGVPLGPEPTPVADNLWGQEFDVYYSMKKYWDNMRQMMLTVFKWQGVQQVVAEELSVLPGMEEASAFLWIEKYYRERDYDLLVIDSAPTGETLTLLTLPQVTQSWLTRAFPGQQLAIKTVGKIVRGATGVPLDKGYEELQALFGKLELIQKIMLDPEVCSIRIVANPERMVVQEAKRAYTYLQLYGYQVDALIVNRVLPEIAVTTTDSFFAPYLKAQQQHLADIEESFSPLPILHVGHQGAEVFGLERLRLIAQGVYQRLNPVDVLYEGKSIEIREQGKDYLVRVNLRFADGKKIDVKKFGDELVISIDNRRRNFYLPRFANYLTLKSFVIVEGVLEILLEKS